MSKLTRLFMLLGAATLSACASTQPSLTHGHSGAVKANIAAQAISPSPAQKANTYIPADRVLTAAARDRYRKGEVKEPVTISTQ